jgi:hypothetical protein
VAAETGFTIEGRIYEEVTLDGLDTDERFLLYEYSRLRQEDFMSAEDESDVEHLARITELTKHPGFWPALWHCAYRRGNPQVACAVGEKNFADVRKIIGRCKFTDVMETLGELEEEQDVPLAPTSEPQNRSESSSLEKTNSPAPTTTTHGSDSQNDSDQAVEDPPPITALRSGTSSTSDPVTSAA